MIVAYRGRACVRARAPNRSEAKDEVARLPTDLADLGVAERD